MTGSSRARVVLIDPLRTHQADAARTFGRRFELESFTSVVDARASFQEHPPQAIVLSTRQVDGHGFAAAKTVRTDLGREVFLVVVGAVDRPLGPEKRLAFAQRHEVDVWVAQEFDASALDVLLWDELMRRARARAAAAAPPRPAQSTVTAVKEFLTRERHIIPMPERKEGEEPGFIELLNSKPTAENLGKLFRMPIGGKKKPSEGG